MRIHELAKELGVSSKELLETLEKMGVAGKSASSSVPEDLVPRLRASGGKATKAAKPREVLEPPPRPRRPRAKPKPAAVPPSADEHAPAGVAAAPGGTATAVAPA
ncbi:MAG TPA: translation initiation factor IF-2 N-terminal domain-containing protein, partial [Actinomycetota bacterium]|nr:translation initiation factor IF-2 N-terminal domain-containing protein [Actinomycetota bacterium]